MDETAGREARESAIDALEAANECDSLAAIVEDDGVEDGLRELALDALAGPQCGATMESLAERDDLPTALTERARSLLEDVEDVGPQ